MKNIDKTNNSNETPNFESSSNSEKITEESLKIKILDFYLFLNDRLAQAEESLGNSEPAFHTDNKAIKEMREILEGLKKLVPVKEIEEEAIENNLKELQKMESETVELGSVVEIIEKTKEMYEKGWHLPTLEMIKRMFRMQFVFGRELGLVNGKYYYYVRGEDSWDPYYVVSWNDNYRCSQNEHTVDLFKNEQHPVAIFFRAKQTP